MINMQANRIYQKRLLVVIITLFLLMLNSCSKKEVAISEEFSTPEKTYRLWLDTAEKGDIQSNNRCVTEASQRLVDSQMAQMEEFMKRMSANLAIFKTYTIMEQKSKEDKAVVILKSPKGDIIVVPLAKEAEGWKIDLISLFGGG